MADAQMEGQYSKNEEEVRRREADVENQGRQLKLADSFDVLKPIPKLEITEASFEGSRSPLKLKDLAKEAIKMDSDETESDFSDIDSNPFARRVLRSPRLGPKKENVQPVLHQDEALKRRVPQAWHDGIDKPLASPSKKQRESEFLPLSPASRNLDLSISSVDSAIGNVNVNTDGSLASETSSFDSNTDTDTASESSAPINSVVYGSYKKLNTENNLAPSVKVSDSKGELVENLILHRLPGENLGMILGIEGGHDGSERVKTVVVKSVAEDGAACRAMGGLEGICVGDEVLEINGKVLNKLTHDECISVFQEMPLRVLIKIKRSRSPGQEKNSKSRFGTGSAPRSNGYSHDTSDTESEGELPEGFQLCNIVVHKVPGQNLGLSIVPSYGSTRDFYQIKRLLPSGACAHSRKLKVGDRLLACNGKPLRGLTQAQCLSVLKTTGKEVSLRILRSEDNDHQMEISVLKTNTSSEHKQNGVKTDVHSAKSGSKVLSNRHKEEGNVKNLVKSNSYSSSEIRPNANEVFAHQKVKLAFSQPFSSSKQIDDSESMTDSDMSSPTKETKDFVDVDGDEEVLNFKMDADNFQMLSGPSKSENNSVLDLPLIDIESNSNQSRIKGGMDVTDSPPHLYQTPATVTGLPPFNDSFANEENEVHKTANSTQDQNGTLILDSAVDIPPPMEFADNPFETLIETTNQEYLPQESEQNEIPVTNIDDILMEVNTESATVETDQPDINLSFRDDGVQYNETKTLLGEETTGQPDRINSNYEQTCDLLIDIGENTVTASVPDIAVQNSSERKEVNLIDAADPGKSENEDCVTKQEENLSDVKDQGKIAGELNSEINEELILTSEYSHQQHTEQEPDLSEQWGESRADNVTRVQVGISSPDSDFLSIGHVTQIPVLDLSEIEEDKKESKCSMQGKYVTNTMVNRSNVTKVDVGKSHTAEVSVESTSEKEIPGSVIFSVDSTKPKMSTNTTRIEINGDDIPQTTIYPVTAESGIKKVNVVPIHMMPTLPASPCCHNSEGEEEIKPIVVKRDKTGVCHYEEGLPSSPSKSVQKQIDESAKRDLTKILLDLTKSVQSVSEKKVDSHTYVQEQEIVPEVISREDAKKVLAVFEKWLQNRSAKSDSGEVETSPFKKMVTSVIDGEKKKQEREDKQKVDVQAQVADPGKNQDNYLEETVKNTETVIHKTWINVQNKSPQPENNKTDTTQQVQEKTEVITQQHRFLSTTAPAQKREEDLEVKTHKKTEVSSPSESTAQTEQRKTSETMTERTRESSPPEVQPLASSKIEFRTPVKYGTHSSSGTSDSLSALRTPPRIGGYSPIRSPLMHFSSKSPKAEYQKTRREDGPFQVDVLKGIVGLGIKLKVTPDGFAQVTEIQRNSPVEKNGNIRVGDYIQAINTTDLVRQPDSKVQQVLRLLPRGLAKIVVSAVTPTVSDEGRRLIPGSQLRDLPSLKTRITSYNQSDFPDSLENLTTTLSGPTSPFGVRLGAKPFNTSESKSATVTSPLSKDTPFFKPADRKLSFTSSPIEEIEKAEIQSQIKHNTDNAQIDIVQQKEHSVSTKVGLTEGVKVNKMAEAENIFHVQSSVSTQETIPKALDKESELPEKSARKIPPKVAPKPKARSSLIELPTHVSQASNVTPPEPLHVKEEVRGEQREVKVPPPVAPKPRRRSSAGSDKSSSSHRSDSFSIENEVDVRPRRKSSVGSDKSGASYRSEGSEKELDEYFKGKEQLSFQTADQETSIRHSYPQQKTPPASVKEQMAKFEALNKANDPGKVSHMSSDFVTSASKFSGKSHIQDFHVPVMADPPQPGAPVDYVSSARKILHEPEHKSVSSSFHEPKLDEQHKDVKPVSQTSSISSDSKSVRLNSALSPRGHFAGSEIKSSGTQFRSSSSLVKPIGLTRLRGLQLPGKSGDSGNVAQSSSPQGNYRFAPAKFNSALSPRRISQEENKTLSPAFKVSSSPSCKSSSSVKQRFSTSSRFSGKDEDEDEDTGDAKSDNFQLPSLTTLAVTETNRGVHSISANQKEELVFAKTGPFFIFDSKKLPGHVTTDVSTSEKHDLCVAAEQSSHVNAEVNLCQTDRSDLHNTSEHVVTDLPTCTRPDLPVTAELSSHSLAKVATSTSSTDDVSDRVSLQLPSKDSAYDNLEKQANSGEPNPSYNKESVSAIDEINFPSQTLTASEITSVEMDTEESRSANAVMNISAADTQTNVSVPSNVQQTESTLREVSAPMADQIEIFISQTIERASAEAMKPDSHAICSDGDVLTKTEIKTSLPESNKETTKDFQIKNVSPGLIQKDVECIGLESSAMSEESITINKASEMSADNLEKFPQEQTPDLLMVQEKSSLTEQTSREQNLKLHENAAKLVEATLEAAKLELSKTEQYQETDERSPSPPPLPGSAPPPLPGAPPPIPVGNPPDMGITEGDKEVLITQPDSLVNRSEKICEPLPDLNTVSVEVVNETQVNIDNTVGIQEISSESKPAELPPFVSDIANIEVSTPSDEDSDAPPLPSGPPPPTRTDISQKENLETDQLHKQPMSGSADEFSLSVKTETVTDPTLVSVLPPVKADSQLTKISFETQTISNNQIIDDFDPLSPSHRDKKPVFVATPPPGRTGSTDQTNLSQAFDLLVDFDSSPTQQSTNSTAELKNDRVTSPGVQPVLEQTPSKSDLIDILDSSSSKESAINNSNGASDFLETETSLVTNTSVTPDKKVDVQAQKYSELKISQDTQPVETNNNNTTPDLVDIQVSERASPTPKENSSSKRISVQYSTDSPVSVKSQSMINVVSTEINDSLHDVALSPIPPVSSQVETSGSSTACKSPVMHSENITSESESTSLMRSHKKQSSGTTVVSKLPDIAQHSDSSDISYPQVSDCPEFFQDSSPKNKDRHISPEATMSAIIETTKIFSSTPAKGLGVNHVNLDESSLQESRVGDEASLSKGENSVNTSESMEQLSCSSFIKNSDQSKSPPATTSKRKWKIFSNQSEASVLEGSPNVSASINFAETSNISLISPDELVRLIDMANETMDNTGISMDSEILVVMLNRQSPEDKVGIEVKADPQKSLVVSKLTPGGLGDKNGQIKLGDCLLSLNGKSMDKQTVADVNNTLENPLQHIVLVLSRGSNFKLPNGDSSTPEKKPVSSSATEVISEQTQISQESPRSGTPVEGQPGLFDIVMKKGVTGVGFCLEGGKGSPRGDLPITVKRLFKGGPAEKCGQLKVKDEILKVNDIDFTNMRHYEAWNQLKFLPDGDVHITVRRK